MSSRKRVLHGQKRKMVDAIGTLANSSTPTCTIDLNKGDVFTATTYSGTAATGIIFDFINAYPGAKAVLHITSSNASDAHGSVKVNGDAADTELLVGSFDDSAENLVTFYWESVTAGSSVVIVRYETIA